MTRSVAVKKKANSYRPPEKIVIVTASAQLLQAGAKVMREAIQKQEAVQGPPHSTK